MIRHVHPWVGADPVSVYAVHVAIITLIIHSLQGRRITRAHLNPRDGRLCCLGRQCRQARSWPGRVRVVSYSPHSSSNLGRIIRADADCRIEQLYAEVSASSNVEASNILMFLADGRELKHDILQQAWDRGGEAGTSSVSFATTVWRLLTRKNRTIAYLFDRETFFVDAEISAAKYAEEIQLPPQLPREPPSL